MNTPIFFNYKVPFGDDSLLLSGRALCVEEFGNVWMYGVNPGMICGEGPDIPAAYTSFRIHLLSLALDALSDSTGREDFMTRLQKSFDSTNQANLDEWEAARQRVRAGESPDTGDLDLRREMGDASVGVSVIQAEAEPGKKYELALQTTKQSLESVGPQNTQLAFAA